MLPSVPDYRAGDALSGIVAGIAHAYDLSWNYTLTFLGWPVASPISRARGGALDILAPGREPARGLTEHLGLDRDSLRDHVLERYDQTVLDLATFRAIAEREGPRAALARRDRWTLRWAYRGKMPACIECFSERPYRAQISWRLGIQPICLRHGLTLTLTCPHCDGPAYGTVSGRSFRRFASATSCISCGAEIDINETDQRAATSTELAAAHQVSDWLETAVVHKPPELCQRLRAVTDWAQALQPVGYRRAIPNPGMVARVLPQAVDLAVTGGDSIDPNTLKRIVAWRLVAPERRNDLTNQTSKFTHTPQGTWQRYALVDLPDLTPEPERLPELMPMSIFNQHFADLFFDAATAVDLGLTVIGARRAATIAVLSGLTGKATRRWVQGHEWSNVTLDELLPRVRDGISALGRDDEYYAQLKQATSALARSSVDYTARAALVDTSNAHAIVAAATGITDQAVSNWLNEEYACRRDPALHANAHHVRAQLAPYMRTARAARLEKRLDRMAQQTAA